MGETAARETSLEALVGERVVLDVRGPYIYLGTLQGVGADAAVLADADVHACDDSVTTRELYVLESKKNGIRVNRHTVYVMRSEIVSFSRLDDVVEY